MSLKKATIGLILLFSIMLTLCAGFVPAQATVRDLTGRVIFLDAGHGVGATGGGSSGTYVEHVRMLYFAYQIAPLLTARGATVYLTRSDANDVAFPTRIATVNIVALRAVRETYSDPVNLNEIDRLIGVMQSMITNPSATGSIYTNTPFEASRTIHPDMQRTFEYLNNPLIRNNFLLISLHSNAPASASSTGVRGAEVYYLSPTEFFNTGTYYSGYPYVSQSRNFADILLNHIAGVSLNGANIPRRSNGLRAENYYMMREVGIPSVLAENGYHTNATDRSLLQNNTYMSMLASAYVSAISQYFSSLPLITPVAPVYINEALVEQFVTRLYVRILGRQPDKGGFQHWKGLIMSGNMTGAQVAYHFFFCNEFLKKNVTNEQYVDILYRALLNREPDRSGRKHWLDHLNAWVSREDIFTYFANSPEYSRLCTNHGIPHGSFANTSGTQTFYQPPRETVEAFVTRFYNEALGRRPDSSGLRHWTDHLITGRMTASAVAMAFITSPEMGRRSFEDDEYVEMLYRSILGRASDRSGKRHWVENIENGMSRLTVAEHFAYSPEFYRLCDKHMIRR